MISDNSAKFKKLLKDLLSSFSLARSKSIKEGSFISWVSTILGWLYFISPSFLLLDTISVSAAGVCVGEVTGAETDSSIEDVQEKRTKKSGIKYFLIKELYKKN